MEALEFRLLLSGQTELAFDMGIQDSLAQYLLPAAPMQSDGPLTGEETGGATVQISGVPEYIWYHGCGPTAGAMVLGYWDSLAYPNYFTGDASTQTSAVNDLIASPEHIDDYADATNIPPYADDPPFHNPPDNCLADFMGTSVDPLGHGWSSNVGVRDGLDAYAAWRGYSAAGTAMETAGSGFTWSDLQGEIDAGRPMVFLVDSDGNGSTDHFVPIIGYRTSPRNQYACYTTWASSPGVYWYDFEEMAAGQPWGIRSAIYFYPSASSPDLAATHADVSPEPLRWGDSFTFNYGVKNYGMSAAGSFKIKFYASTNSTISTGDTYLGEVTIGGLAVGATTNGAKSLWLPGSPGAPPSGFTDPDDIYIGMIIDADGSVSEGVENNNSNLGLYKDYDGVHINAGPDLVGTSFSLDLSVINVGAVTASFSVRNQGQTNAAASRVRFYLSENSTIDSGDTYLGYKDISAISAGATYSGTQALSIPGTDPFSGDGTYYVGMILDVLGAVTEIDETNNSNEGLGLDKARASWGLEIFHATFDAGDGAMHLDNDPGIAAVTGLWHRSSHLRYSGLYGMYYGRYDSTNGDWDYDVGDSAGYAYTKTIYLPNEPAALSLWYWAETESSSTYDKMSVEISVEGGAWTALRSKGSGLVANTGGAWQKVVEDLTAYAGSDIRLRFGFDSVDTYNNNYEGFAVDSIAVWAANNTLARESYRSLKYDSSLYHESSYINTVGDHDTVLFNEEQTDGTFVVRTVKEGSAVNPALAIYDQNGRMIYLDGDSGTGDEAQVTLVNSGYWNRYLVEVWDTEEDSTGECDIEIIGSATSYQNTLSLDAYGDASYSSTVNNANDTDYFRLVAPEEASGTLTISLVETSGDLKTRLQVWRGSDSKPEFALADYNGEETCQFTGVTAGEVFYISVSDNTFTNTGNYTLTANFSTSVPLTMTTAESYAYFHRDGWVRDTLQMDAYVGSGTDVDSFYFAGDTGWTGTYTITVNRLSGSVDPVVAVYAAATGAQLGFDDNGAGGVNAQLTLTLDALTKYIVAVGDADSTNTGDVQILIQAPGTGSYYAITLDAAGDGALTSYGLGTNDTDFFRFVAPADANGEAVITVTPVTGTLDTAVALFDASGNKVAFSDSGVAGSPDTITVSGLAPGAAYYLSVLADDYATTGTYDVAVDCDLIVPDEYPGGYDTWLIPSVYGDVPDYGLYVTGAGDWDGYLFAWDVADAAASFTVSGTGGIIPIVGLYDVATGQRVAWNTNAANQSSITMTGSIAAATRYYVMATTKNGTAGTLTFSHNAVSTSTSVRALDANGDFTVTSSITAPGDFRFFRFTAPADANGQLTVTLTGVDPALRAYAKLWDQSAGNVAKTSGGSPAYGADVTLTISDAVPGHVYDLGVTSWAFNAGFGAFTVNGDFGQCVPATITPGTADFNWHGVNQFGDLTSTHSFSGANYDYLVLLRPETAGLISVTMTSSAFAPAIGLYDSIGARLDWSTGATSATVSYTTSGVGDYYLYVNSYSGQDQGLFQLSYDVTSFGSSLIAIGSGTGAGSNTVNTISPTADEDFFRFVAPVNAYALTVTADPDDASLAPHVRIYDSAGTRLNMATATAGNNAVAATSSIVAGETYYVGLGSEWMTSGAYDLFVQFDLYDVPLTAPLELYGPVNLSGDRTIDTVFQLDYAGDRDAWLFSTQGGSAIFTATADAGINPLIALYGGDGALLVVANSSSGTTETLSRTLAANHRYTVLVMDAEQDGVGNIDLTINGPSQAAATVAINAVGDGSANGYLNGGSDAALAEPDYFRLTAPAIADGNLTLTVAPVEAYRLQFQLFNQSGAPVGGRYSSPAAGSSATANYAGLVPGQQYHVCVFAYQFDDHVGGNYGLSVNFGVNVTALGREVFYNDSAWDGNSPAANAADDAAVAADKTALLPGETGSFANYTSYSRGLNGIMVDIAALAAPLNAADFTFRVGNSSVLGSWTAAPAPISVTNRAGAGVGGSDRVTIVWADGAIQDTWLQVTVLSDAHGGHAGLAEDDVFYFGNAVGDSGNSASDAVVDGSDVAGARGNPHGPFNRSAIDDAYDFNRDRLVNATDIIIARDNQTTLSTSLQLITVPGGGGAGGAPAGPGPVTPATLPVTRDLSISSPMEDSSGPVNLEGQSLASLGESLPLATVGQRNRVERAAIWLSQSARRPGPIFSSNLWGAARLPVSFPVQPKTITLANADLSWLCGLTIRSGVAAPTGTAGAAADVSGLLLACSEEGAQVDTPAAARRLTYDLRTPLGDDIIADVLNGLRIALAEEVRAS